jgi:hypothetical protein
MADVVFARTDDRSVLGTMNDCAFMARDIHARSMAPETLQAVRERSRETKLTNKTNET